MKTLMTTLISLYNGEESEYKRWISWEHIKLFYYHF